MNIKFWTINIWTIGIRTITIQTIRIWTKKISTISISTTSFRTIGIRTIGIRTVDCVPFYIKSNNSMNGLVVWPEEEVLTLSGVFNLQIKRTEHKIIDVHGLKLQGGFNTVFCPKLLVGGSMILWKIANWNDLF